MFPPGMWRSASGREGNFLSCTNEKRIRSRCRCRSSDGVCCSYAWNLHGFVIAMHIISRVFATLIGANVSEVGRCVKSFISDDARGCTGRPPARSLRPCLMSTWRAWVAVCSAGVQTRGLTYGLGRQRFWACPEMTGGQMTLAVDRSQK